jgi:hypothetical protein
VTTLVFPPEAWHAIRYGLFEPTESYAGDAWEQDVLQPWTAANTATLAALAEIGRPEMAHVALDVEDLWTLYALSRVAELLIVSRQPPAIDPTDEPLDRPLPPDAVEQFITAIGGTIAPAERFHPFLHEIVAVEAAEDQWQRPELTATWWPGCLIGSLLLQRGGVTVHVGSRHLDPAVATGSTLYWAWIRRYRPVADLSHGWGHNSQWRTTFRRDYQLADRLLYNVDAALGPKPEHPGGMPRNRDLDLLRYRCRTLVDDGEEQWPWETHHTEPRPPAEPTRQASHRPSEGE